jgi:hypothetical protein
VSAQGGAAGDGVPVAGEGAGGAEQVVRDRGADCPRSVRGELARGQVRQGPSMTSDGSVALADLPRSGRLAW